MCVCVFGWRVFIHTYMTAENTLKPKLSAECTKFPRKSSQSGERKKEKICYYYMNEIDADGKNSDIEKITAHTYLEHVGN